MFKRINFKYEKLIKLKKYFSIKCCFFTFGTQHNSIIETTTMNICLSKMKEISISYYSVDRIYNSHLIEDSCRLVSNNVKDIMSVDVNNFHVFDIYLVYSNTWWKYI